MSKLYIKNIDGTYSPYNPVAVSNLDIVQETGGSLTSAMSQKAVTDELTKKQDTITDLDSIRSNAAKGATALQSYTETDPIYIADKPNIALKSEIPDVSGKADKTLIVTETEGSASYSIVPNKLTKLGTLASSVTLSLNSASEEAGVANIYDFIFTTPTNAPSIT